MPNIRARKGKKRKGRRKGRGGKKAAARAAAAAEAEAFLKTCRKFLKAYLSQCAAFNSVPSKRIVQDLKKCVEDERPMVKVRNSK